MQNILYDRQKGESEHEQSSQNMRTIPDIHTQIKAYNNTSV